MAVREISNQTYSAILKESRIESSASSNDNSPERNHLSNLKPQVATAPLLVAKQAKEKEVGKQRASISNYRRSRFSTVIGNRGEEIILNHLKETLPSKESTTLKWNAQKGETPGWDIQYMQADGTVVAIEVKSTTGQKFPSIELTANEWSAAESLGSNYWLALVSQVMTDEPIIDLIANPYGRLAQGDFQIKPSIWRLEMIQ